MGPFELTIVIGGGLLLCGYMVGKARGYSQATANVMRELFDAKLVDPMDLVRYYSSQGNASADALLAKYQEARKAAREAKED